MMKLTTKHFTRNLSLLNTMPVESYQELLEDHQEEKIYRELDLESL